MEHTLNIKLILSLHIFPGVRDYCETELFNATCRTGEVIMMKTAHYGRMRLGRCVRKDLGYIGCYEGKNLGHMISHFIFLNLTG